MAVTKTATASVQTSENTKLLYYGTVGKGHGRENVKILMDQERTNSSTVLKFKIGISGRETRDASYLVNADCPTKPEEGGMILRLSKFVPGEIEEYWTLPLYRSVSEPGLRTSIAKESTKPLNRLRTALTMMQVRASSHGHHSQALDRLNLLMAAVVHDDSRVFKLRR